jgi:hypothetical protein
VKSTRNLAWKAAVMLGAAVALLPFDAQAYMSGARRTRGKVLVVDRETLTFLVKPSKGKRPLLLNWNKSTRFIHNHQSTNAVALTEGVSVALFYHSPLFSKPYVTKVLWDNGTSTK